MLRKLSTQARWYLNGHWPVSAKPAYGCHSPEPGAMQELVDEGLAEVQETFLHGKHWTLTARGEEERTEWRNMRAMGS